MIFTSTSFALLFLRYFFCKDYQTWRTVQVAKMCRFRFICFATLNVNSGETPDNLRVCSARVAEDRQNCKCAATAGLTVLKSIESVTSEGTRCASRSRSQIAGSIRNATIASCRGSTMIGCDSSPAYFHNDGRRAREHNYSPRTDGPISRVLHRIGLIRPVASPRRVFRRGSSLQPGYNEV